MTEEQLKNIYCKQTKLLDSTNEEISERKIIVYGAGSGGSHITIGLTKLGFKNISVIDFDNIEENNLPAQFYNAYEENKDEEGFSDIEKIDYDNIKRPKVEQLGWLTKIMTGTEINIVNAELTEKSDLDVEMGSIHICCLDSIEARKLVFEKLKGYPVHFIDGRIGGFNAEKYYVDMMNDKMITNYEKSLEGTFSELECGEKCLWAVNSLISSKILADVIKIVKGQIPNMIFKTNLMGDVEIIKRGGT